MPDTLKAQHIARLTRGCVLYSDMERILCSITADSLGCHDPLSGCSNAAIVEAKYGTARYQELFMRARRLESRRRDYAVRRLAKLSRLEIVLGHPAEM